MYIKNGYDKAIPFPIDVKVATEKGAKWHYDNAVSFYSHIMRNKTELNVGKLDELYENRKYANGEQDWFPYAKILLGIHSENQMASPDDNSKIAKGWMSVNFRDVVAVLPKFKSIIVGMFTELEHEVDCYAYNELATTAREELKWGLWAKAEFRSLFNQVQQYTKGQEDTGEYIPSSIRELQLFEQLGGLKLKEEVAMEMVLSESDEVSDWTAIEEELISDAFETNMMCVRDYVDAQTGFVRKRRVDPLNSAVILNADKKVIKGAELRLVPISDLRLHTLYQIDGEKVKELKPGSSDYEELLKQMLSSLGNEFGNNGALFDEPYSGVYDPPYGYDPCVMPVLEYEFVSSDRRVKVERDLPGGVKGMFTEKGKGELPESKNGKSYKYEDVHVLRKVSWLVGTRVIFDFGLVYDQPRPKMSEVNSTFHFAKMPGVPPARRCKRPVDDIQLANLRIQNAIAMAPPGGFAYEFSNLNIKTKEGKDLDFLDIIKMHTQTGRFIFSARNPRGAPTKIGDPIIPLAGGAGPILGECMEIIQKSINEIQMYTGLNEIVDGSTPKPRVGVGLGQIAAASTNNALKQMYNRLIRVRESSSANIALRVQIIAKTKGNFDGYASFIGRPAWKALQVGDSFIGVVHTTKFIAAPTREERQEIEIALEKAMAVGKNGQPLLTASDYFFIKRSIKSRSSLKLAQAILSERERVVNEEQAEREKINMEMNTQMAQQIEAQKAQSELQKEVAKSKLKMQEETHKIDQQIRLYRELKRMGIHNVPGMPDLKTELENQPPVGSEEEAAINEAQPAPVIQ